MSAGAEPMAAAAPPDPPPRAAPRNGSRTGPRYDRLDALRGLAIVWMAAYHFAFDLNHFGLLVPRQFPNRDLTWVAQRTSILSLFLFCAGMALAVALHHGQSSPRFWRRWAQVAGCAVAVSIGSALVFPHSWIHFGVLHGIALMLLLARPAARLGVWLWPLGLAALVLPRLVQAPLFDGIALNWTGLVTRKPVTEDYVPLFPWIGVMLWGLAAGRWALSGGRTLLSGPLPRALHLLAVLGRWSLSFYMVHQPVFFGLLMGWQALRGRP